MFPQGGGGVAAAVRPPLHARRQRRVRGKQDMRLLRRQKTNLLRAQSGGK